MTPITPEDLLRWIAHLESCRSKTMRDAVDNHLDKVLAEMRAKRDGDG